MQVNASSFAQRITLNKSNVSLESVLKEIRDQSGYDIFFDRTLIDKTQSVTIQLVGASIDEALAQALIGQFLSYSIKGKNITLIRKPIQIYQNSIEMRDRILTGTVISKEDNQPLSGVSIGVKEISKLGTITDENGKFSLKVPEHAKTIIVSYLGFVTLEVDITKQSNFNIGLGSNQNGLNEVVVTAGGASVARRELGNQSTTISGVTLNQAKSFNIGSALSGKVAGLQVNTISSGVNPTVRLVLRGNRSILGDNEALVVVDNVVVPNTILGNLNPEDVEDIQVLNGAGAAALFGSGAANGAIMITTKRAKNGETRIGVSQTTSFETVSYFPQLQKTYGAGTGPDDVPSYDPQENQQYGPAFDGSLKIVGLPLADGSVQKVPYSYTDERDKFWDLGVASQSDFNISSGERKASYYISAQYFDKTSIVPGDKYNRFSVRVNGDKDLAKNIRLSFSANYVQNRYNTSTSVSSTYNNILQTPSNIPITSYEDWRNNPFANPNGYFNKYYTNPYFTLANNRGTTRNDYLTGNIQLKWFPISDLSVMFRVSLATQNASYKNYRNKFTYTDFSLAKNNYLSNILGSVSDGSSFSTQLNPEFQLQYIKNLSEHIKMNVILGSSIRDNNSKNLSMQTQGGLIAADLFNINNSIEKPLANESIARTRQIGIYFDSRFSYKNFLSLNITGRNDWRSVLDPKHRSFFYPSASLSFIASEVIPILKDIQEIESIKLRAGISQVGSVQIGSYSLIPTFGQGAGFPYNGVPGYTIGSRIVSKDIAPEMTKSFETGFDIDFYKSRLTASVTYYKTNTTNQTMSIGVSPGTGFSSYLTNIGLVTNQGLESAIKIEPIRLNNGLFVILGGNYTYNTNKVIDLNNNLDRIILTTTDYGGVYALKGKTFPTLRGSDYYRDPEGRIIVDRITGYPKANTATYVELGNTEPRHKLGLDAEVSFKGLRFSTLFEYRAGAVMYSEVGSGFDFSGASLKTTSFNRERFLIPNSSYLDPVTNTYVENTNITVRNGGSGFWASQSYNTGVATNYTFSGAFWKLREVAISYNLPKSVVGKIGFVKDIRLGLQGRNLFIWKPKTNTYTDPEYSNSVNSSLNAIGITTLSQTPPIRFYGASISITL